jgi:hypothetical protein
MKKIYDFLGGRKVLFALILTAIITTMVFFGYAEVSNWTDFMKWVFVAYVGGNGAEHIAQNINKK